MLCYFSAHSQNSYKPFPRPMRSFTEKDVSLTVIWGDPSVFYTTACCNVDEHELHLILFYKVERFLVRSKKSR